MSKRHAEIIITGRVQRVGLRFKIMQVAIDNNLHGYARNMKDGTVLIELEGEEMGINRLLEWIGTSPGLSKIENQTISGGEVQGYRDFRIF